jgi:hypothetical protein
LGHSPAKITKALKCPDLTVRTTIKLDPLRDEGHTRQRSGRPREYDERDVRKLIRYVRANPKDTWAEVKKACGLVQHPSTIRRMLEPSGITNWKCRRRLHLTEAAVKKRLEWCKARKDWTLEQWRQYMWSDECSVERGKGGVQEWCFRTAGTDKWTPAMV